MKLVIAATGASGTIYLQRLLEQIDCAAHEIHLIMSAHAEQVAAQELKDFKIPAHVLRHSESDLNVPFVSGSARFDAMVIVPCSRRRCFFEGTPEINSRPARDALEFDSRAQRRDAA